MFQSRITAKKLYSLCGLPKRCKYEQMCCIIQIASHINHLEYEFEDMLHKGRPSFPNKQPSHMQER